LLLYQKLYGMQLRGLSTKSKSILSGLASSCLEGWLASGLRVLEATGSCTPWKGR